jgi:UDP-N-acetylglucosamine--N-acetylmuramyl-(pentapeptide) pyrophosphoryl-undecaprenol N-acetylglucosamine transferase
MAGKDVEAAAVRDWDGPVITVSAEGFRSIRPNLASARTLVSLLRAGWICRKRMAANRPDVLLAMGSYASVGPAHAALRLDVPIVLHESNVIPGRAVSMYAGRAAAVAAAFEETRFYLPRRDIVVTGMPLRPEILRRRAEIVPKNGRGIFTVLIVGGSRGARRLNELVVEAVRLLGPARRSMRLIHLTGAADEARIRAAYEAMDAPCEVQAFTHDIGALYHRADLAVCRSGAATCAELMLFELPALLVPYPHAARNHQAANAMAVTRHGAADLVEEKDLDADWLAEYLEGMSKARPRLARMRAAMSRVGRNDAAGALADLVERCAGFPPRLGGDSIHPKCPHQVQTGPP